MRNISSFIKYLTEIGYTLAPGVGFGEGFLLGVEEVAPLAKSAVSFVEICATLFSFVFRVGWVVLLQLVGTMGELAFPLIGTVAVFHELPAQLWFLFVRGFEKSDVGGRGGGRGRRGLNLWFLYHIKYIILPVNSSLQHSIDTNQYICKLNKMS